MSELNAQSSAQADQRTVLDPARVWLITGSSSGFGLELAEQVLDAGGQVAATARRPEQVKRLEEKYGQRALAVQLDVTDQQSVDTAVQKILEHFGRIDVLVNNAGYGLVGAIEEASEAEYMQEFNTNLFGLLRVTRAVLPTLRAQKSGHILNISSIAGLVATPGLGYYNASKFAVNGLSEALAGELAPLGIHVTIVEPGPFRTDFLGRSSTIAAQQIADYAASSGKARNYFTENDGKQVGDPVRGVRAMIAAVESPEPPLHLLLGSYAVARMQSRLELWQNDLEAIRPAALAADFPEGE